MLLVTDNDLFAMAAEQITVLMTMGIVGIRRHRAGGHALFYHYGKEDNKLAVANVICEAVDCKASRQLLASGVSLIR